jgi:hypothetical protein
MIAVYCPEERQVARIYAALRGMSLQRTEIWALFSENVAAAACAVVMVDWLAGNPVVQRLEALRVQYPHKPLILVTRKDADNVRLLRRVEIEEVVWTEEIEHALAATVDRTRQTSVFQEIAAQLESAHHLPNRLKHAMAHLFRSPNAITTVEELATSMGCDRRTLWRMWRSAVPDQAGIRLQDMLDWNVLLRATVLRMQCSSWVGIATRLSVHEHTLARAAKRLTSMTLRELAASGSDNLINLFKERTLSVLVRPAVIHAAS